MKTNASIFRDQPLPNTDRPAPLYVACQDHDDAFDTFLRGLLVACMMSAMAILGLELTAPAQATPAPQTAATSTVTPTPHAVTAAASTTPPAKTVCCKI